MTVQIPSSISSITNPNQNFIVSRPWFTFFENLAATLNTITINGDVISVFGRAGIVVAEDGDYTASQVTNVPSGSITATNVQSAINQLGADVGLLDVTSLSGDNLTYYPVFVNGAGTLVTPYINSNFNIINASFGANATEVNVGSLNIAGGPGEASITSSYNIFSLAANDGLSNLFNLTNTSFQFQGSPIQLYPILNGMHYSAIQASNSLSTSYTLTLPTTTGSSGNVLSTDGTGILSWAAALSTSLTDTNIFIGNSFNVATQVIVSGDATLNNLGVLTLANTGVTAGIYGDSTHVAQFDIDSKGRIITASNVAITGIAINSVTANNTYYPTFTSDSSTLDINTNLVYTISGGLGTLSTNALQVNNTGLQAADLSGNFFLTLKPNSTFTANRTLSITTGDSNRNLTLAGDATISGTNTGDITLSGQNYLSLAGQALTANQIDLTTNVINTLPVSNGGTGQSSLTQYGVLIGQGTGAITALSPGSSNGQLLSNFTSSNPRWTDTIYPFTSNQGDIIYATALNDFTTLAKSTASTRYLSNQGTSNNPSWSQVNLSNGVTGTLARSLIATSSPHTFIYNDNTTGALTTLSISTVGNFPGLVASGLVGEILLAGTSGQISITSSLAVQTLTLTLAIDSGYIGQTSITTLGTITTGTWHGTQISEIYGGTNQTSYTLGDTLYSSASNTLSKLAGNITTTKQYLSQTGTGTVSAAPAWSTISGTDITGQALTATNDTNVTITLGGTPATALLRAASITMGWTGQLGLSRGGTGSNLSVTGGTSQVLRQSSVGAAITVSQLAASDLSNGTTGSGLVVLASSALLSTPNIGAATGTSLTITQSINSTSTDGFVAQNLISATSSQQQWSPRLRFTGQGWKTNTTAASQTTDAIIELQPVSGAANPTFNLVISGQINGGGYSSLLTIPSGGGLNLNSGTYQIGGTQIAASNLSNGTTGSGSIVLATSPALTTPTATSMIVGASSSSLSKTLQLLGTGTGFSSPGLLIGSTGQSTDNKYWGMDVNGTTLYGYALNDAGNSTGNWLQIVRSGTSISSITMPNLTLSGLTSGSIIYAGTGGLISQNNSQLFWDTTNTFLGVGINSSLQDKIHAKTASGGGRIRIENGDTTFATFYSKNTTNAWSAGTSSTGAYLIYNETSSNSLLTIDRSNNDVSILLGNVNISTAGKTLKIKQGSNACAGTGAVLVGGTVTVSTTAVATGDIILLNCTAAGGAQGIVRTSINNGVSFTITSSNGADTSTYSWVIIKAA